MHILRWLKKIDSYVDFTCNVLRSVERFGMGYGVLGKRSNETKDIKSYTKIYKLSRWKFQILIDVCRKSSYYNPLCSYQKHVHTEEFLGVFRSWSRQFYIFCSGGGGGAAICSIPRKIVSLYLVFNQYYPFFSWSDYLAVNQFYEIFHFDQYRRAH